MAVVLYGPGIVEMRGAVGGVAYTVWRGIGVAKRRSKPTPTWKSTQPFTRSILGWLSRHFGTISSAERELWQIWADEHPGIDAFGNPFIMTALNMYIKLNSLAMKAGGSTAVSDTPPLVNLDQTITNFVVSGGALPGEIDCDWLLPNGGDAGDFVQLLVRGPLASPALRKNPKEMDHHAFPVGTAITFSTDSLVEGTWYWFAGRYVGADGQTSNWHVGQETPTPTP